ARLARAQPDANGGAAAGRDCAHIKSGRFGAFARGVDRLAAPVDDVFVESVLAVTVRAADAEYAREVGLILAEQQSIRRLERDRVDSQLLVLHAHARAALLLQ